MKLKYAEHRTSNDVKLTDSGQPIDSQLFIYKRDGVSISFALD